ncbi:hypothetical protein [Pseudaquabacterium pictum]|uniref:Uncharacterized protein n=1 Tax=Pseudaquabacterium pictum TaxID=2315236 RepID=A0A480ATC8_9BURK|nr:hypothetical protein [Rubrivivax pictus]GCL64949.1 hypothetical protein AQPW35_40300 [Rubrivivax pictus]
MTPAERARWLRAAAQWLPTVPALAGTAGAPFVAGVLEQLARAQAAPLTFRQLGPARWLIGTDSPAEFEADLMGLRAAWTAIDAGRGQTVMASDFAAPGARQPANVVRAAIRETAAPWVERETGSWDLAAALRSITIERGALRYRPVHGARAIITR